MRHQAIKRLGNERYESDKAKFDKGSLLDELLEDSIDLNDRDLEKNKENNKSSLCVKKHNNAKKKEILKAAEKNLKKDDVVNLENFDIDKKGKNKVEKKNDKSSESNDSRNYSSKFSKTFSRIIYKRDNHDFKSSVLIHRNEKNKESIKNPVSNTVKNNEINEIGNINDNNISMNLVMMINNLITEVNKLTLMISNLVLDLSKKFTKVENDEVNVSKINEENEVKRKYKDYIDAEIWNKMSLYERMMKRFKFTDYRQNLYEDIWTKISKKDKLDFLLKKYEWRKMRAKELIKETDSRKINNFLYYEDRTKNGFLCNYDNFLNEENITLDKNTNDINLLKKKLILSNKVGDIDGYIMYDGEKIYNNGRFYLSIINLKLMNVNPDNAVVNPDDSLSYNDDFIMKYINNDDSL